MAKASPAIVAFNAGQLSPLVDARVEKDWYRSGCKTLENFIPLVQGPAMRDPGTRYVAAVKNSADRTWFGRFEFSAYEAYVLEFGDGYIRFFADRGQLNISAPAAYGGAINYAVGDLLSYLGVNYYVKAATIGNVPPNATYYHPLTGTVYEIPAPWAVGDLDGDDGEFALDIAQKGDLLYVTHRYGLYEPVKISRYSDTKWVITRLISDSVLVGGPFEDVNETTTTVYASAATGSVTLTASASIFTSSHIGGLFYLERKTVDSITAWQSGIAITSGARCRSNGKTYVAQNTKTSGTTPPNHSQGAQFDGQDGVLWLFEDPGYGTAIITAVASGTSATATAITHLPYDAVLVGNASTRWAFGSFSAALGWPTHVTFFRERLTFAKDQTVYGSVSGDLENFAKRDDGGNITIEQAWTGKIAIDQPDSIKWMSAGSVGLLIGTTGAELAVTELTTTQPFGPGNATIGVRSSHGSRGVTPEKVNNQTMFVQRSGRMLRSISVNNDGSADGLDLSVRNDQLTIPGIIDLAYQREPWSVLWVALANGKLLGLTYNAEQEVIGWHTHTLGGVFGSGAAVVEAIECIPSPTNDRDDLWMIVKRTINGATKRYVEVLVPEYQTGDDADSPFYLRSGLTYDGAATSTITGLSHLEGQTVSVLADGAVHPQRTVSAGAISLQVSASVVHVGLPYRSTLQTMRLEAGASDGTAQGKIKRVTKAAVRLFNTLGMKAGPDTSNLDTIQFRSASDDMNAPPPIFTGDKFVPWPSGYETDAHLVVVQDDPLPMTVVGIFPQVVTQDGG